MNELLELIKLQNWYGLAVLLLPLVVQALKRPGFWDKLPARLQPLVPVLIATGAGFSDALARGESFSSAAWQAVSAGVVVGLGAIGIYETYWRMKNGARGELLALMLVVGGAWATTACAASLEGTRAASPTLTGASPRDSTRCQVLDDRRQTWGAVGTGALMLGGASGLGTIPFDERNRNARIALASGAAALAVVAAVAQYVEQESTESWATECSR